MPLFSSVRSPSFDGAMLNFSHLRQRGQADLNGDTKKARRRNGELPCDKHAPTIRLSMHHFGEVINAWNSNTAVVRSPSLPLVNV